LRVLLRAGLIVTIGLSILLLLAVIDGLRGKPAAPPMLPQTEPASEPMEAKLTVKTESDPLEQVVNKTIYLHVLVGAHERFTGVTQAVDPSGQRVATIEGIPVTGCPASAETLYTGTGSSEWCLKVSGLQDGAEMTGIIKTGDVILTIALSVRDHFLGLPLLVVILGLLLAGSWLWWTTRQLEVFVSKRYLDAEVNRNETESDVTKKIVGLKPWVDSLKDRYSPKSLYQMVDTMLRLGPGQARAARERLLQTLTDSRLPPGHPIKGVADTTVANIKVSDFYDELGKAVEVHPADKVAAMAAKARALYDRLTETSAFVEKMVPASRRPAFRQLLAYLDNRLDKVKETDALNEIEAEHVEVRQEAYRAAAATPSPPTEDLIYEAAEAAYEGSESRPVSSAESSPFSRVLVSRIAIMLTVGLFSVLGAATVASASYLPNATFGLWSDYLALFIATVAASSVSGALTALGLWSLRKPLA
jgi:hypothetical protein